MFRVLVVSRNPLFRLLVFVMGILAELQRIRAADQKDFPDINIKKTLSMISFVGEFSQAESRKRKWKRKLRAEMEMET